MLALSPGPRHAAGMDPDVLCVAVRRLLPGHAEVLGAFEAKEPSADDDGFAPKVVVAWTAEEVFVLSASVWKGKPMELLGRMPLVAALLAVDTEIPEWDGSTIVVAGESYRVRERHASEADRLCKAWRSEVRRAGSSG